MNNLKICADNNPVLSHIKGKMQMDIIRTEKAYVLSTASVVGSQEKKGPLGECFDLCDTKDDTFGKDSFEKSEAEMQRLALRCAMDKLSFGDADVNQIFAGDLVNQCISSGYGLADFDIPFMGIYGACSTFAEGVLLSSVFSSFAEKACAAVTSSHNCTAERQFRFPLEYGAQRTPTSQWTVTGSGAVIISNRPQKCMGIRVSEVLSGKVVDAGITDVNNMGAAMAPAAADTLIRYFKESGKEPESFDYIVTGDLGFEGSSILLELMKKKGIDISSRHTDCGMEIYNRKEQDMHAGGSGCGCSAVVMASYFLPRMKKGDVKDMIFVGTGAMMNSMSLQQGLAIPSIGHLVRFQKCEVAL